VKKQRKADGRILEGFRIFVNAFLKLTVPRDAWSAILLIV
jgi:hypothetical protein